MKTSILHVVCILFLAVSWATANEPNSDCGCTAQSEEQTASLWSGKLFHYKDILKGFEEGQERVKVIVNLVEPTQTKARTNWHSRQSLKVLQDEIETIRNPVISALGADGFRLRYRFENQAGFSGEVTPTALEKLENDPRVESIEPVYILEPHLRQGIPLMRAGTYRSSYNGTGVAIAICDTGIDYTHPKLGNGGFPNSKVLGGYDYGDSDSNPMPDSTRGHGTCCAGIAAGDLGDTGDYIGGVAYNAKLYALKITPGSSGSASSDAMIAAWNWCISHKNDDPANPILVVSTSFGGGRYYSACDGLSIATAVNNAVTAGITMLASSGNDGYCDSISQPACVSNMISVGAVYDAAFGTIQPCISSESCATKYPTGGCSTGFYATDNSAADMVTSYSNTASILTLLGPANQCYTTDIVGSGGYSSGDYYTSFGGTSAACPYAAGAVACLQSAAKAVNGSYLSPSEVRAILTSTGDNITDGKVAITKPRVNLEQAIEFLFGVPTAYDVYVQTPLNTAVTITLIATDEGLPNPPGALSYIITSLPANGGLSDPGAGAITAVPYTLAGYGNQVVYTPAAGYAGIDTFLFKASDGGTPPTGGDSNQATVSVSVGLITLEYLVTAGNDDGYASSSTYQNLTNDYLRVGYRFNIGPPYYMSGMRFTGVAIPSQAQIVSAQLKIRSYTSYLTSNVYGMVQGEDTDNAAGFSSRMISGAVKTTASVDWDHLTNWFADTWYFSPDISSVIQEIVDRAGWSSGNALVILYSARTTSGGSRYYSSYDRGSAYAPKLEVVYIEPVTLTVSSTAGGSVTTPGEGSFNYKRGTAANITAAATTGYHFVSWTGSGVTAGKVANPNSASTTITMDANYTVVANFAIDQMTLTSSSSGNGNVTMPGEGVFQYSYGTIVNLAAAPATGYHFVNWTGSGVTAGKVANPNSASTTITMDGNYTVVANFAINTYTISGTVTFGGGGLDGVTINGLPGNPITSGGGLYSATVDYGWSGTAVPVKAGYTFTPGSINYTNVTSNQTNQDYSSALLTYTISGIVTFGGSGLDGVTINGLPGNPITSGGGLYSAIVDYGWSGTAIPVKAGYTFTPDSINYTNVTSNQTNQDYSSTLLTYTIWGYVLEPDDETPVEGVLIDVSNGGAADVTDANGLYEAVVPYGWSGTAVPTKEGYTFEPNGVSYSNVVADEVTDYTAALSTYIISGYILESEWGTPIPDVNVVAENDGGPYTSRYGGGQGVSDPNGYYEVIVDYDWSGAVTPSKYAYGFEPNSRLYANIVSDWSEQDYTGRLLTFVISGFIYNDCYTLTEGVSVSADNGGGTDTTDPNGYYAVWVDYNWSGTVRPEKVDYTFIPADMVYINVLGDVLNQDYLAGSIYDFDRNCFVDYGDLMRIAENWLKMPAGINEGDFNDDDIVNFFDFAKFAQHWLEGI